MSKYPFKTNEWIEEEVKIPAYEAVLDEKNKRIEYKQTTKKATRRTQYIDSKPRQVVCGEHVYHPIKKGSYTFRCAKCDWHLITNPRDFKYDPKTRIVTYRETGIRA